LWTLVAWQDQSSTLVSGDDEPAADEGSPGAPGGAKTESDDPFHKRPPARRQLEMQQARWCIADADLNAVVLCPDAAVVAAGVLKPTEKSMRGVHPGFARWELVALDRATGKKRWSVALPGEPVFNGLAPAADGSWVVVLRDGGMACVEK
jgi:hypothetical protein